MVLSHKKGLTDILILSAYSNPAMAATWRRGGTHADIPPHTPPYRGVWRDGGVGVAEVAVSWRNINNTFIYFLVCSC